MATVATCHLLMSFGHWAIFWDHFWPTYATVSFCHKLLTNIYIQICDHFWGEIGLSHASFCHFTVVISTNYKKGFSET